MALRNQVDAPAARHRVTTGPERRRIAERILGHVFSRPDLLDEALTHRSAAHGNRTHDPGERRGVGSNERLEFIGDRVLGLVMAEWLIERYPEEQEGELGRRYAHLVSRPVLAGIAEGLGVQDAMAISPNDARAGVASLATTLADTLEATLGALFIDAGLGEARRFVRGAWTTVLDEQLRPPKDAKTELQERLLGRRQKLPTYTVSSASGPAHAPAFTVSVSGAGQDGVGTGSTKREAEQAAAADLLGKLKL